MDDAEGYVDAVASADVDVVYLVAGSAGWYVWDASGCAGVPST